MRRNCRSMGCAASQRSSSPEWRRASGRELIVVNDEVRSAGVDPAHEPSGISEGTGHVTPRHALVIAAKMTRDRGALRADARIGIMWERPRRHERPLRPGGTRLLV